MSIENVSLERSLKVFSKLTFWTQIRLILSRIYSFFQQKTYKKITPNRKKMLAPDRIFFKKSSEY